VLSHQCNTHYQCPLFSGKLRLVEGGLWSGWYREDALPTRLLYREANNCFALLVDKFCPSWVDRFSVEYGLYRLGRYGTVHFYVDCGLVAESVRERGYSWLHWGEAKDLVHRGLLPSVVINK
jgi:hypothetical protein